MPKLEICIQRLLSTKLVSVSKTSNLDISFRAKILVSFFSNLTKTWILSKGLKKSLKKWSCLKREQVKMPNKFFLVKW